MENGIRLAKRGKTSQGVSPTFSESFGETLFPAVGRVWELSRKGDLLVCTARYSIVEVDVPLLTPASSNASL
ncbi:hypothetical protein VNO77_03180 [Canavalia gladiata]|uniref:Uncharacterized protein n=1 Tax=Canavalia gladiata TaxID=3824 RepID=A0AAN9MUX3_CANGL